MSHVKHIITKKIYKLSGAEKLGIRLSSGMRSYNEKGHPKEMTKFGITKKNYICSLVYNRRTEKLRLESPVIYQFLVEDTRVVDPIELLERLKEMILICKKWMCEPQYYGLHELILIQKNGVLEIIDNSTS